MDEQSPEKKLTPKQRLFVETYTTNGFNATQAAITAGYSETTAYSIGSENLKKPEIAAAIDRFFEENTMTAKEVLLRLTEHARGDIGDIWDPMSGQVNWDEAIAKKKTHLIKKLRHKTTRISRGSGLGAEEIETFEDEIELHNPQFALHLLGKQHGLFVDKSEVNVKGDITVKAYQGFTPDEWDKDADTPADDS